MAEDSTIGGEAARWGRETARHIAAALGATAMSAKSNVCTLNGKRVVIKTARSRTTSVVVTFLMLKQVDAIIAAFRQPDGSFDIWSVTRHQFERMMRDAGSAGPSGGRSGLVSRKAFEQHGQRLGRLVLPTTAERPLSGHAVK